MKAHVLVEKPGPFTSLDVAKQEKAYYVNSDELSIPMLVLSASDQEKGVPTEATDDECDDDCESFYPSDLMSFARQIARGMVRKIVIYKETNSCWIVITTIFVGRVSARANNGDYMENENNMAPARGMDDIYFIFYKGTLLFRLNKQQFYSADISWLQRL